MAQLEKKRGCDGEDLGPSLRSNIFLFLNIFMQIWYSYWLDVYHAPSNMTIQILLALDLRVLI